VFPVALFFYYLLENISSNILNKQATTIPELASGLSTFRKKWLRGVLEDLPFVNVNHYMHEGTEHGPQLLVRDGSLALFGSSRIEKIHQKIKMDIRRHLGSQEWSKTLLVRWMRRSDPDIRKNKPVRISEES
jgi:hypothetical protein